MNMISRMNGALFTIAALIVLMLCTPPSSEAASGRTYRVHGQVIAVNVTQTPHMIVVKTPLTTHDDMTVGAKVTSQTRIIRNGKRIALQAIRMGERVWLTYIKQRDGVFAQTIQAQ
jgi:predicted nucleic acid-binding protein